MCYNEEIRLSWPVVSVSPKKSEESREGKKKNEVLYQSVCYFRYFVLGVLLEQPALRGEGPSTDEEMERTHGGTVFDSNGGAGDDVAGDVTGRTVISFGKTDGVGADYDGVYHGGLYPDSVHAL